MQIVFRVDASTTTGGGHVMRCLTLAETLRSNGAECYFICRRNPGNMIALIEQHGFEVSGLPSAPEPYDLFAVDWQTDADETVDAIRERDPDWLVVDHYGLSAGWEERVTPPSCRRLVIDDLINRNHVADILLNQNLGADIGAYAGRVPEKCLILAGVRYALLRSEFQKLRESKHRVSQNEELPINNLLISFGGADPPDATGWVLDRIAKNPLPVNWKITVVMGSGARALESIRERVARGGIAIELVEDATNMAELIDASDLALGAGGASSWERCCLGLPTIVIALADNQLASIEGLVAHGAAEKVALYDNDGLDEVMERLINDRLARVRMANAAYAICDGGGAKLVAGAIAERSRYALRKTCIRDAKMIWDCRLIATPYPIFKRASEGSFEVHTSWLENALNDRNILFFTCLAEGNPIGYVRINKQLELDQSLVSICLGLAAHGRGLGSKFLNMACAACFNAGIQKLVAEVHIDNIPSQKLFAKCGFYKLDGIEDESGFVVYERPADSIQAF